MCGEREKSVFAVADSLASGEVDVEQKLPVPYPYCHMCNIQPVHQSVPPIPTQDYGNTARKYRSRA